MQEEEEEERGDRKREGEGWEMTDVPICGVRGDGVHTKRRRREEDENEDEEEEEDEEDEVEEERSERRTSEALSQKMGMSALTLAVEKAGAMILRWRRCCSPSLVSRPV